MKETVTVHWEGIRQRGIRCRRTNIQFGFQGQESEPISDYTESYFDFMFRKYDPRIGRFLSTDPLDHEYPWNSRYAFSENRLIDGVDLEGREFYFTADGTLLGRVGKSTEIRVIDACSIECELMLRYPTIREANKNPKLANYYLQHSKPVSHLSLAVRTAVYQSIWNREMKGRRKVISKSQDFNIGGDHIADGTISINPNAIHLGEKITDFYYNVAAIFAHEEQHDVLDGRNG